MSWYTFDETANDLHDGELLHRPRPVDKMIPYIKEALKVKPDLHLWAEPMGPALVDVELTAASRTDAQTDEGPCPSTSRGSWRSTPRKA
jgi:hypothetical protein